jgi:hypothetical protein
MRVRTLVLAALCASVVGAVAAPAFADDDWQGHDWRERQEWRERQAWREHEWRERQWREQQRREYYREPSVVIVPGVPTPPGVYNPNPGYYPRYPR